MAFSESLRDMQSVHVGPVKDSLQSLQNNVTTLIQSSKLLEVKGVIRNILSTILEFVGQKEKFASWIYPHEYQRHICSAQS